MNYYIADYKQVLTCCKYGQIHLQQEIKFLENYANN